MRVITSYIKLEVSRKRDCNPEKKNADYKIFSLPEYFSLVIASYHFFGTLL